MSPAPAGPAAQEPLSITGARVIGAPPGADAILMIDGRVTWVGAAADLAGRCPAGTRVVEAGGGVLTPAFVDAHVHLTESGRALAALDLGGARHRRDVLDAVRLAAAASPEGAPILGHGWDESTWSEATLPTPAELEAAGAGREVYLSRIDVHAGLASAGLLARAGLGEGRRLGERDHARVRALATLTTPSQARSYQSAALARWAATGHGAVAEMAAPHVSGLEDLRLLLDRPAAEEADSPAVDAYWAGLVSTEAEARGLLESFDGRLSGLGGDLSVDGSIGARTAAFRGSYADLPAGAGHPGGELLLSAGQIAAHVAACTRAGAQAAFHVIGDAALDAALEGFSLAAREIGAEALRAARHRLEHVEATDAAGVLELAAWGVRASVQPRFDEYWGFPNGLYEQRLGSARALGLNPFGSLARSGVPLAFGSDAPVTGAAPWRAVHAALTHHAPGERLSTLEALDAHTRGGHVAAGREDGAGTLVLGAPAHVALWRAPDVEHLEAAAALHGGGDAALIAALAALGEPECWLTVRGGRVLHSV